MRCEHVRPFMVCVCYVLGIHPFDINFVGSFVWSFSLFFFFGQLLLFLFPNRICCLEFILSVLVMTDACKRARTLTLSIEYHWYALVCAFIQYNIHSFLFFLPLPSRYLSLTLSTVYWLHSIIASEYVWNGIYPYRRRQLCEQGTKIYYHLLSRCHSFYHIEWIGTDRIGSDRIEARSYGAAAAF